MKLHRTNLLDGYVPTVLVVDDQPENLAVLGGLLEGDYLVRVANSGPRALAAAGTAPRPDLILLDVSMPQMTGHEVLHHLLADPATADIPVIFVTSLDDARDEEFGFALGAVDYITKPIKPAVVLARVRTHVQFKRARDLLHDRNVSLEAEVELRVHDYKVVQDVAMRALASLAETRDNETGNHIRRTQAYVELLAGALVQEHGTEELHQAGAIEIITKAAPLHDIGKVGIPDHILNKPGPLSPDEWAVMKQHSSIGAEAIEHAMEGETDRRPLSFLHVACDIALHHHEKWDGTGYPNGLAGEQIPIAARLMAVADVFDALISRRVYKPAFSHEKAAGIIRDGRGSHFDPRLVDIFVARLEDIKAIARRYTDEPENP